MPTPPHARFVFSVWKWRYIPEGGCITCEHACLFSWPDISKCAIHELFGSVCWTSIGLHVPMYALVCKDGWRGVDILTCELP